MDFTDSMAHLYGSARSAVAECMNACVALNTDGPWWESDEYHALEASHKAFRAVVQYMEDSNLKWDNVSAPEYFIPASLSEVHKRVDDRRVERRRDERDIRHHTRNMPGKLY